MLPTKWLLLIKIFKTMLIIWSIGLIIYLVRFDESTVILHQSNGALGRTIDNINISTRETNNLIDRVNNLNKNSSDILEKRDRNIQQETAGFNNIQSELARSQAR